MPCRCNLFHFSLVNISLFVLHDDSLSNTHTALDVLVQRWMINALMLQLHSSKMHDANVLGIHSPNEYIACSDANGSRSISHTHRIRCVHIHVHIRTFRIRNEPGRDKYNYVHVASYAYAKARTHIRARARNADVKTRNAHRCFCSCNCFCASFLAAAERSFAQLQLVAAAVAASPFRRSSRKPFASIFMDGNAHFFGVRICEVCALANRLIIKQCACVRVFIICEHVRSLRSSAGHCSVLPVELCRTIMLHSENVTVEHQN